MTSDDDDDKSSSGSNYIDPLLKKQYLTNIRIKVNMTSKDIVGVTADSLVASESEVMHRKERAPKKARKIIPAGVRQKASGNWVRMEYLLHCYFFKFLILILLCSCPWFCRKLRLAIKVNYAI